MEAMPPPPPPRSGVDRADAELVHAARAGDERAFAALVERHEALAIATAFARVRDLALAEDLAQEAFVVAWSSLARLREQDRFAPWLCGIVRNVARADRRHRRRHAPAPTEPLERLAAIATGEPTPLDQAAQREELARTWDAIAELAIADRAPLLLFWQLDGSYARVAAALGLREEAVRQRICRARGRLRDRLAADERAPAALRARRGLVLGVIASIAGRARGASAALASRPLAAPRWLALVGAAAATAALLAPWLLRDSRVAHARARAERVERAGPPAAASPVASLTPTPMATFSSGVAAEEMSSPSPRGAVRLGVGAIAPPLDARAPRPSVRRRPARPVEPALEVEVEVVHGPAEVHRAPPSRPSLVGYRVAPP
jgi:RNA polymerase sigma-70 factor (ECF subfamily)